MWLFLGMSLNTSLSSRLCPYIYKHYMLPLLRCYHHYNYLFVWLFVPIYLKGKVNEKENHATGIYHFILAFMLILACCFTTVDVQYVSIQLRNACLALCLALMAIIVYYGSTHRLSKNKYEKCYQVEIQSVMLPTAGTIPNFMWFDEAYVRKLCAFKLRLKVRKSLLDENAGEWGSQEGGWRNNICKLSAEGESTICIG